MARLAAELADLLRVLDAPPAGRGSADFAPATLADQEACFLWNGFVVLLEINPIVNLEKQPPKMIGSLV
jgi:hypothetical protein